MTLNNVRITLRNDDLSNWISSKVVLLDGELALVKQPNGSVRVKVGNGTDVVSALPYIEEKKLETKLLSALSAAVSHNVAVGAGTTASSSGSIAAGLNVSATADAAASFGHNAITEDTCAFVWNGSISAEADDTYKSHGKGTFSINPVDGLSGVYIGEQRINELLADVQIDGQHTPKLDVQHVSRDEYCALVENDSTVSSTLYIVSADTFNMYGERITNVGAASAETDAATFGQVSDIVMSAESRQQVALSDAISALEHRIQHSYKIEDAQMSGTSSLSCQVADRTVTVMHLSSADVPVTVLLPPKADGYARDFLMRIEISADTAPQMTFTGIDEDWEAESEDAEWMVLEPGVNIISFTETRQ